MNAGSEPSFFSWAGLGSNFATLISFAKPALQILAPTEYHEAHTLVFWLAASGFYMGANNIVSTGIWLSKRTIFSSYAQGISFLIVIIANFLLVPSFILYVVFVFEFITRHFFSEKEPLFFF